MLASAVPPLVAIGVALTCHVLGTLDPHLALLAGAAGGIALAVVRSVHESGDRAKRANQPRVSSLGLWFMGGAVLALVWVLVSPSAAAMTGAFLVLPIGLWWAGLSECRWRDWIP